MQVMQCINALMQVKLCNNAGNALIVCKQVMQCIKVMLVMQCINASKVMHYCIKPLMQVMQGM